MRLLSRAINNPANVQERLTDVDILKVLAGLDLIGIEYHFNHVDYFTGAHKSPEYAKINPHKTVPCAVDGDCVITESNAILQYAADHSGNHSVYPTDLKKRAAVNRWLLWEGSAWFPSCYVDLPRANSSDLD